MLAEPPLGVEDDGAAGVPGIPFLDHVHPDAVLVPVALLVAPPVQLPEGGREEEAVGLQDPVELEQPAGPLVREVREDGECVDEVEEPVGLRQLRLFAGHEDLQRRGEMLGRPGDARLVDVAAVELRALGLRQKVAQGSAGAAAEVEDALSVPGPVLAQQALELPPATEADCLVLGADVLLVDPADALHELDRRIGRFGHHSRRVSGCFRTKRAMLRQCQSVRRVRKRRSVTA